MILIFPAFSLAVAVGGGSGRGGRKGGCFSEVSRFLET